MNISIFGLGYVGCVSLGCLAENGFSTIGVDVNKDKVKLINAGIPTVFEKDIDLIIRKNVNKGKIYATVDYKEAVLNSDAAIICVGTPSSKSGHLDLKYIYNVAEQIGKTLRKKKSFFTVLIRSTVPPGTNEKIKCILKKYARKDNFGVVSNPEFLREGTSVYDYYNPPYTVIASESEKALRIARKIYSKINAPVYSVSVGTAEVLKFINNSFHALKVAFTNEIGSICKELKIDSHDVMDVFLKDEKLNISSYYMLPGFAYGGPCLPKDLKGLNALASNLLLKTPVINSVEISNKAHIKRGIKLISDLNKKKLGFLGLSFKSGTDDMRNSPAIMLIEHFIRRGYKVKIFDKNVDLSRLVGKNKSIVREKLPNIKTMIVKDINTLIKQSEVLVICNREKEYDLLDIPENKFIVDFMRIENLENNINYTGISW